MIRFVCIAFLFALLALAANDNSNRLFAQGAKNQAAEDKSKDSPGTKDKNDDEPVSELRVLCYNIHAGRGLDKKLDLARIAAVIKSTNPDLVALQEVDVKTKRSGKVDQAKQLAKLCNMTSYFGKAINYQGGGYGNAILSSKPIIASNTAVASKGGAERRVAVGAAIQLNKKEVVTLISTHFDHKSKESRASGAKTVADIVRASNGIVLVAGDLNCNPGSPELAPLEAVCEYPSEEPVFTFPAAKPTKQIDFILVDSRANWKLKSLEAIDAKGASDHRPLLAIFEIPN